MVLPEDLAVGYAIREVRVQMREKGELAKKFTFSGSVLFEGMKARGLYSTRPEQIAAAVDRAGLMGVFDRPNP